jgi:hypothetical protein
LAFKSIRKGPWETPSNVRKQGETSGEIVQQRKLQVKHFVLFSKNRPVKSPPKNMIIFSCLKYTFLAHARNKGTLTMVWGGEPIGREKEVPAV